MTRTPSLLIFLALLAIAGVFVDQTVAMLPERIASHFNTSGQADNFASRADYLKLMLLLVLGVPALVATMPSLLIQMVAPQLINLPHREYWLAPERRKSTKAYLVVHNIRLGMLLLAFLYFLHWELIQANEVSPPHLDAATLYGSLALLLVAIIYWVVVLRRRFQTIPASTQPAADISRPQRPTRPQRPN